MAAQDQIRLDACRESEVVHIAYSLGNSWKSIGRVEILKIKPLAKAGRVQIKCRTQGDPRATVRKFDLSGDIQVKRIDLASERATDEHAGVTYVASQGGDPQKILAEALEAETLQFTGNRSIFDSKGIM